MQTLELFLSTIYNQYASATTPYKRKKALRDIAVAELLFSTGMRISELCNLSPSDVNLNDNIVLIYGKGAKERKMQIGNTNVINILIEYKNIYSSEISKCTFLASIEQHITPHMFRHTFASSLLDADVDIRYIQEMLGHSSINTTQIYTHVTMAKQKNILTTKHPRNKFNI